MKEIRKAVVTVLGKDRKGIIARVSNVLYETDVNIMDITQTIFDDMFSMVLMADITDANCSFEALNERLSALGEELGLQIRIQRSEIFEAMYQV